MVIVGRAGPPRCVPNYVKKGLQLVLQDAVKRFKSQFRNEDRIVLEGVGGVLQPGFETSGWAYSGSQL